MNLLVMSHVLGGTYRNQRKLSALYAIIRAPPPLGIPDYIVLNMKTPECEKRSDSKKCTHRWSLRSIREHPNDALLGCSERDTPALNAGLQRL